MGIRVHEQGSNIDLENRLARRTAAALLMAGFALAVELTNAPPSEIAGHAECNTAAESWQVVRVEPYIQPGKPESMVAMSALVSICPDHR